MTPRGKDDSGLLLVCGTLVSRINIPSSPPVVIYTVLEHISSCTINAVRRGNCLIYDKVFWLALLFHQRPIVCYCYLLYLIFNITKNTVSKP